MLESTKEFFDQWGKPREGYIRRRKKMRLIKFTAIGLAVLLLAFWGFYSFTDMIYKPDKNLSSIPVAAGDWAMFGRDPLHSGTANSGNAAIQGDVKALFSTGQIIYSSPAVSNGVVYFGSRDNKFYAIDADTGARLWEFRTGSWVESSPAIVNNVVYFGSNDGHLYALNALTGTEIWRFQTPFPIKTAPAVAGGRVYFGCDDYSVYALDAKTGKKLWSIATGDVVSSSLVVANGLVFFGSWDGYFYAVDAKKGSLHLKMPSTRAIVSSPIVDGTTVYFINSAGTLMAVDGNARNWPGENRIRPNWQILYIYGALPAPPTASGFLWSVNLGRTVNFSPSSPTLVDGMIYAGVGKKVVAVDLLSKKIAWETETGENINSTPIIANNLVYATGKDGYLYVMDASTGEKLREIAVGADIHSTPALVDGAIYITSTDGNLYRAN